MLRKLNSSRRGGILGMHEFMRKERLAETIAICFFAMLLSSCAGLWPDRIGGIVLDREAALIFEKKQCGGDYQFYYSGSDLYPSALMGVRKDIRLEDDTPWKKVDMTPERCVDMVSHIQTRALGLGLFPYGFVIQDDQGRRIGVWYSILTATTPVWMVDHHTAVIHTPAVDTYLRYEKDPE
jgi:hypothetical protein